MEALKQLSDTMVLGALLAAVEEHHGEYELLAHWKQGEFHHDVVLRAPKSKTLPGPFLIISTNCNGGVKEVLCFAELPERWALWKHRCPDNPDFHGTLPPILGKARTSHWFDPCELLKREARSELRPEFRKRQQGGGWEPKY